MKADSRKLKIENLPIKNFKLIVEWRRRRRRIMDNNKKKTLIVVDMTSEFVGYDKLTYKSKITAITTELGEGKDKKSVLADTVSEGAQATIIVPETPFYATMGGQIGDKGIIKTQNGIFVVEDTVKVVGRKIAHIGYVESGELNVGD